MKTLGVVLSIAGLAGVGLAAPAVARAVPPTASSARSETAHCDDVTIVSAAYLRRFGGSPIVGAIQLKRDSCDRYWGVLVMYDRVPQNAFASAYLTRFRDGRKRGTFSCESDGGTGYVGPGDTTCRTPKVRGRNHQFRFVASGHEYHGGYGWAKVSWGQTPRMR